MTYWIIASDGQAYGPADLSTLARWVSERRVLGTTPVARSKDGPWQDAALVPELASAFGAPPEDDADPVAVAGTRATPPTGPIPAAPMPPDWPPQMISIPQLVSGILNLLAAVAWLATCFGVVIAVPLAILGIAELVAYSHARTTPPAEYVQKTRTKAILDICTALVGNVGSLICGIIMLTQMDEAKRRIGSD
jgi:hypothetical protein